MRLGTIVSAVAALAMSTAPVHAQCGTGGGRILDMPPSAAIGTSVTINMSAPPPEEMVLLMFSLGQGPVDFGSYGTICLDMPPLLMLEFTLDANGNASATGDVPCDPSLIGLIIYAQFLTCHFGGTHLSHGSSNQESLTITDGSCEGGLCTFTPGGWGAPCSGNNAGCIRDKFFDSVYPGGVSIGDPDGVDGDGVFAIHLTSAAAVEAFLPSGGTPAVLTQDETDPKKSSAGSFAGQLLAAKLAVDFDDAGALDGCKTRLDLKIGDTVFVSGVNDHFIGMSVRDFVAFAESVISGALGAGPYDVDGDGVGDVSVSDISDALDVLNSNFDDGTADHKHLGV